MSYLVLARKYRPQTFDDLAGQDHVARTLANAIATGRVAHAFLFTGVRGVGKTTSARLLAKCLNCVGPDGASKAPTSKPCNRCAPCAEITAGQDLDVQEIDGASYNGVDEVRRLQEGMTFRPARDRFKIYIVDEVHMLSTAAWNAFLKTLEEPPPHVKFIFATTEAHKVPITILSRCQRYDFKLIATQLIAKRLDQVLSAERITAEPAAVQILAREAAGSMRDAMSLLDQVIAFSGDQLTADAVTRVLGVADRQVLHDLAAALIGGDAAACLTIVARLAEQGFDLTHVARDVLHHLRDLVVARVCAAKSGGDGASLREMLDLADDELRDVQGLAARADADDLSRVFQGFSQAFDDMVRSGQPRLSLEMTLVRLARRPPLVPVDDLLARLADLERRLGGAPPPGPVPRGGGGGGGGGARTLPADAGTARSARFEPVSTASSPGRTVGALALAAPPAARPAPPARSEAARPAEAARLTEAPRPVEPPRPLEPSRPVVVPTATPAEKPPSDLDSWRAILDRVRVARPAIASIFDRAVPLAVSAERLVLAFEPGSEFLVARATEQDALDMLTREAREHFGAPTQVSIDASSAAGRAGAGAAGPKSVATIDAERRLAAEVEARAEVRAHPVVEEAVRVFGAKVIDVKLPPSNG